LLGRGDPGTSFLTPLREAEVGIHTLEVSLRTAWAERRFIRHLCLELRPDLVHTHGYRPDILDGGVARRLGLPTLSTEHGMSRMGGRTAVYEWLQMRAFRRFEAVAAVSQPISQALAHHGVDPGRIQTIPNAWADDVAFLDRGQARRELGLPADEPILGWMGRLIGAKGGDVFLRALARLGPRAPRAALLGHGPEREALERLAAELGLAARIQFTGEVAEGARYLRAFDAFVLSSRTEGTPIVLFEAIAAGLPLVVTRVGGVPNVVGEAEALSVASEDEAGLADAIDRILSEPAQAHERAARARTRLDAHFGLEPWLDRYETLYRSLVSTKSAPNR
jgi:glycosyltransferase involved in cell wall biosynthesis